MQLELFRNTQSPPHSFLKGWGSWLKQSSAWGWWWGRFRGLGDGGCPWADTWLRLPFQVPLSFILSLPLSFSLTLEYTGTNGLVNDSDLCMEELAMEAAVWVQAWPRHRELRALFSVLLSEITHPAVEMTAAKALFGIQWQHQFMYTQREKCRLI